MNTWRTTWRARLTALSWRRWAVIAAASLAVFLLVLIPRPGGELATAVLGNLLLVPAGLLAAIAAVSLNAAAGLAPRARRVWTFLGLAVLMWAAGGALWAIYRLAAGGRAPLPSIADPVYMAGHLLAIAALIAFPVLSRGRLGRFRVLLDLIILASATLVAGWLMLIDPLLIELAARPGETLWLAVYPLLDLLVLALLANAFVLIEPADWQAPHGLVSAGLIVFVVADLIYTYLGLRGQFDSVLLFEAGRLAAFALIGLGARLQLDRAAARGEPAARVRRWLPRVQALLPLAAAITLGWYLIFDWQFSGRLNSLGAWAIVLLGLALIARQGVVAGEVELAQYAQLVNNAADPAFISDSDGRLQLVNPALRAATGYRRADELIGQRFAPLLDADALFQERGLQPVDLVTMGLEQGWSGEVMVRRRDDTTFPAALSLRPAPQEFSSRGLLAGTLHDLTEHKRQQAALFAAYEAAAAARRAVEDLNAQLEEKVAEKTRSLSEAYEQLTRQHAELQTLDQLKSDFVSLVSHELRAPLTNIAGGIELMLARRLPERPRATLTLVQAEIQRLTRFVETILDLSALEAGRLPLRPAPLPLAEALEAVRAQFAARPDGDRLRVQLPPDLPPVLADGRGLSSVLFHLIDNAFKYAPTGDVRLEAAAVAGRVRVTISDRGPGVPPAMREAIFERFQRLNVADAQSVYGHGLGLYMVRRLLRAMGGDVWVSDSPGDGAHLVFELPCAPADE